MNCTQVCTTVLSAAVINILCFGMCEGSDRFESVDYSVCFVQVMLGALSLQAAESEPDAPNSMASLSTAHKMLSQVLACKGKLSRQDTAVVCWLLARTEFLGNLRRKQEKAEAHVMQVRLKM